MSDAAWLLSAGDWWLPDMDLNHDKQIQSLLCYRYTIGQTGPPKVAFQVPPSRTLSTSGSHRQSAISSDLYAC
jgi:hypothetical protein